MSEAGSIHTSWTVRPRMSMPRIASACDSASSASFATLIPPALPRPPICTWAFTTTGKSEVLGRLPGLLRGDGNVPLGHGDAVLGEQLFALVLEQIHIWFRPPASRRRARGSYQQTLSAKPLPIPKTIDFVSLEVYGTLIDWETGIYDAFQKEAERDGFTIDRNTLIPLFLEKQAEIMSGSYELYAEVLRRTAIAVAEELGWELEPVRSSFLPNSVPSWKPFRDSNALLDRLRKKYYKPDASNVTGIGLISNIDDKLLGATRRHLRTDFDLVVTAQQVRSYKPDPAHFKEAKRRLGTKTKMIHVATGLETDVIPCVKLKIPVIWIDRKQGRLAAGREGQADRDREGPALGREAARRRLATARLGSKTGGFPARLSRSSRSGRRFRPTRLPSRSAPRPCPPPGP